MELFERFQMHGFQTMYVLPMPKYEEWTRLRTKGVFHHDTGYIVADAIEAYPFANALLVGVYPYQPYRERHVVASYYPASNQAYHAIRAIGQELKEEGMFAEIANVPLRECLLRYGIGSRMDSQLLYIKPYGTYFVLQALAVRLENPKYSEKGPFETVCDHCGACRTVCTGAILGEGHFSVSRCIRAHYEDEELSLETMQEIRSLLGCMACQNACPKQTVQPIPIPDEIRETFDAVNILTVPPRRIKELVGFNYRVRHIKRQAIVLLANQGRVEALPILLKLAEENDPFYRKALDYAISLLQNQKTMVK